jgi:hypothetical protein
VHIFRHLFVCFQTSVYTLGEFHRIHWKMGFCFVLDQLAELDVYIVSSLKQQSKDRHTLDDGLYKHPTQRVGLEQNRSPSSSVCPSVDCCLSELAI